ncbi:MAG: 16S rRNA (uracil(1498)-N(3))-methyltransferase [Marinobacter sp.]|uniref:16S rRNA (uracil(1498)-N(3))-methyltransferase n=1 Tax=Marinobacter sp. TaxID=50741 RepID=UPI00299D5913|nr:16S rRNA (uracil(1498)-N(3))-methyltransferase [Marinobacter sp.]MDX1755343.1 16S rRNA (uracil(1498)-N(3))-methyltransferase [Marinobacter sp.]
MRIPRIHTPVELATGGSLDLDEKAAQHVGRVLRMQPGQALLLFNGDGLDYPATIAEVGKRRVTVSLGRPQPNRCESPLRLTLGQTLSKGDRMDYAIQKSVEMGVTTIVPLATDRCDVRLKGDREEKRLRHWQAVAISAAEQCGRARVPEILPVMSLDQWFQHTREVAVRLVLHHRTSQALTELPRPAEVALLIGPEGGLTEEEIAAAERAGFLPTTLGARVMRTETAPVAAMAVCQWLWGDFAQPPEKN